MSETELQKLSPANICNLDIFENIAGDLLTGIPDPVKKNIFKAFGRLCTAAVEYPVSIIENSTNEKRAESVARVKIIETSANQIMTQMQTNPEYAKVAVDKFAQKILRERINLDKISQVAAHELKLEYVATTTEDQPEVELISEDWLNIFENEAAHLSSDKMQKIFGKILAGEIKKPASYSIKTIKLMAQLDTKVAEIFHRLCSISVSIPLKNSTRTIAVSMGQASSNSLESYGLGFEELNILQEYGLINPNYDSHIGVKYDSSISEPVSIQLFYQKHEYTLLCSPGLLNHTIFQGVMLSQSGLELFSVVSRTYNKQYIDSLKVFFESKGSKFTQVVRSYPFGSTLLSL